MKRQDFNYVLPEALIASEPLAKRTDSRLMVIAPDVPIMHRQVSDLIELIEPGDVLVANNTRVFPARLFGEKASGGRVEVMIERLLSDTETKAFVKASNPPKSGAMLNMDGGFNLEVTGRDGDLFLLRSPPGVVILKMAEQFGHVPLPPYIKRTDTEMDRGRYQTVYAKDAGAVAAPTAGLHIDEAMIDALKAHGAHWCEITLHVGAGTFNPVRVENLSEHQMHSEWYRITEEVAEVINEAKSNGRRVISIGTTSMRCLEGAADCLGEDRVSAQTGETSIFITPGYRFRICDALFTNFHLPESTLFMLVSAFGGYERMLAAYQTAVESEYRFFSYGDACLITCDPGEANRAF